MKKLVRTENIILSILLVIPFLLAIGAYWLFDQNTKNLDNLLAQQQEQGFVAGVEDNLNVLNENFVNEVPIIYEADIASFDTTDNQISMTLSTDKSKDEINIYYEDYFFINGWEEVSTRKYKKDQEYIEYEVDENFVKLTLTKE